MSPKAEWGALYLFWDKKWAQAICYPIKTNPWAYESARFTEDYLYPIDFHLITFHDLLHLHFVLCLVKTPHLRQEMNTWMDELYWIAEWIETSGNGYIPAAFFLPRSNILDTAPGSAGSA
ncbi:hypothetical protein Y032_0023g709 [Ancylostoma ceylanicum]|uniref:Uncharacterized protein n=1 Tax=Ancylostoma ceylanicum TaxID=53326 RepID=A0A016UX40_9BILA|nr:hypothetical protein Y032_0023g709 [Ancylostoma ceylanicum]